MQPPIADFYRQKIYQAANKAGQAASSARQFVSGAANAFTNPTSFASSGYPVARVNRFASSGSSGSGSGIPSDGEYKMFTRAELNDLYGNQKQKRGFSLMNTNFLSLGNGATEHIIMMVQLYIALIAALSRLSMNAASMSASFLFGNETLINLFSIFLENALNLILNRRVGEMTLDDLHKSLKENQPKLQQMSALLINAISALAVGLSSVCSKIVEDWVENVLPGLLKSSAKGAASAAKAGLNVATVGASDEILDILSSAVNIAGGMIKVLMGLERNVENFSEVFKTVKNAYDELKNLKDLFGKPPSEIANAMRGIATTATAAVIPEALQNTANSITTTAFDGLNRRNSYLDTDTGAAAAVSPPLPVTPLGAAAAVASAASIPSPLPAGINPSTTFKDLVGIGVNRGVDAGIAGLRNFGSKIKGAANTFSNFLTTPKGETVTDSTGTPIKTTLWNRISKSLFDGAMNKIKNSGKYGDVNQTIVEYVLRNPDILIPFLPVPYNIAAVAFRLVQTYLRHVRKPNNGTPAANPAATPTAIPGNTAATTGRILGGGRGIRNKNKSMKYKNKKHFKRYMSNLRRKTEKKELQLLNGIRDFKSMI